MIRDCYWLSDAQFARLMPHLPTNTRGKPRVDDRRVISGIVHVLKSGGRWRDAPSTAPDRLFGGQSLSLCVGWKRGAEPGNRAFARSSPSSATGYK